MEHSLVEDLKYQCNICYDVLKDACLTECCGQHYCDACLTKWDNRQYGHKTCPQCRKENFRYIKNKSLMRDINSPCSHYTNHAQSMPHPESDQCSISDVSQKYSCRICKIEPLKEPCLTECCGQHFCRSCLTDWLQTRPQKICPCCRQENFAHILNKSLKREIEELYIMCTHHRDGCEWVGHPEYLNGHLTSGGGCEYVEVECNFKLCHQTFQRKYLEKHMKICRYRHEKCEFCGLVVTHSAIHLHHDECPEYILSCPNHCDPKKMTRRELKIHYETCPLEPLKCQFKDAGCTDKIVRKDMKSHMEDNTQQHMLLLQQQNRKLRAQNWELRKRNRNLLNWNGELNNALENLQYLQ